MGMICEQRNNFEVNCVTIKRANAIFAELLWGLTLQNIIEPYNVRFDEH